jgi:hypothetical protein
MMRESALSSFKKKKRKKRDRESLTAYGIFLRLKALYFIHFRFAGLLTFFFSWALAIDN